MAEKATDYIAAGVIRVWIVDPAARSITVFQASTLPVTHRGDSPLKDDHFPDLALTARNLFHRTGLLE